MKNKIKRVYLVQLDSNAKRWSGYIDNGDGLKVIWHYPTENEKDFEKEARAIGFSIWNGANNYKYPKCHVRVGGYGTSYIFLAGEQFKHILKNQGYDISEAEISTITGYAPSFSGINQPKKEN